MRNNCSHGKATSNTYSECVSVALVIQLVQCMSHIIQSSVACLLGAELFHVDGWMDRRTDMTKLILAIAILRTRLKVNKILNTMPVRRNIGCEHDCSGDERFFYGITYSFV